MKVDYNKIYEYLKTQSGKLTTANKIAYYTGIDRIYGGTMAKLVREGVLEHMPLNGYYRVLL